MLESLLIAGGVPTAIIGLLWGLDRLEEGLRLQPSEAPATAAEPRARRAA